MKKNSNPILTIPANTHFQIPVYFSDDQQRSYFLQLKKQFSKTIRFLEKCNEAHFRPCTKREVVDRIDAIQKAVATVIEQYLKGHPAKAYTLFKEMLENYGLKDEINCLQQYRVEKNAVFFRTQRQWTGIPAKLKGKEGFINFKKAGDLFHPPFQKRRSVATNRFSISGYPCLYLSESIQTSYSECFPQIKDFGAFNAIGLRNIRPLYFIDLSADKLSFDATLFGGILAKGKDPVDDVDGLLSYLGIYQVITASHTKIAYKPSYPNEKYYFKAEYIIPQLLLQWLKLEGFAIDGIRYKSCTALNRFKGKAAHYNYVLPVQSNLEKGFCPSLAALFACSPVYSNLNNVKPANTKSLLANISKDIKKSTYRML